MNAPYLSIIFPGQGSQAVGMCSDFAESWAVARDVFAEADDALGYKISEVIANGPEADLTRTATAQPAIMTASIAVWRVLEAELGEPLAPAFFAGHSLGEYTALVASGVLSFADAVRLVRRRGELMQSAVPEGQGAMAAILGMDPDDVVRLCADASQGEVLGAANMNSPVQTVISGTAAAVERASAMALERGAAKAVPLKVSAPFHCELMRPVADELAEEFARIEWREPTSPIMTNLEARPARTSDEMRRALLGQTYSTVRWSDDVRAMRAAGAELFLELGPGNVLTGLMKRIDRDAKAASASSQAEISPALALINDFKGR